MYSLPSKSNVVGSSITVVAGVTIGCTPSTAAFKRRRVHKRLERGTRLAPRQNVVQLALAVIATPDQRLDFAGMRVQDDDAYLGLRRGLSFLAPARIALRKLAIDVLHSNVHGLGGGALQLRIERGIHAKTLRKQVRFGKAVEQDAP